jgi:hypothetical protein
MLDCSDIVDDGSPFLASAVADAALMNVLPCARHICVNSTRRSMRGDDNDLKETNAIVSLTLLISLCDCPKCQ